MTKDEIIETTTSSEWFDATKVEEKPSRLSGIIFVLLPVISILTTIAYGGVDVWALGLLSVGVGLVALLWLVDSFFSKQFTFHTNLLQFPLLGLILIGFIQLLPLGSSPAAGDLLSVPASQTLSIAPYLTQMAVVLLIIYLVYFAASLTFINSQTRLRTITFTLVAFGAFMAFLGVIQFLSGTESIYGLRATNGTSPFASFGNKHHFAALMEMLIGLTMSLLYGEATKKDKRLLLIIALVLMGMVVILTGSRGGLLSLLGVVGFVTFFNLVSKSKHRSSEKGSAAKSSKKLILVVSSLGFVLVLFSAVLLLGGENTLLRGIGVTPQTDISTGRSHFWQIALQVIRDNPLLGTGLDTFGNIFPKYDTWNGNLRVEQVHNDYLQIFSDAGIFGFICAIAFVVLLFRQGFQTIRQTSDRFRRGVAIGALAGCFGILFHSFFDFPLRTPANAFIFLTLVVLATGTINYPKLYRRR